MVGRAADQVKRTARQERRGLRRAQPAVACPSTPLAILAPHSHAIRTTGPSTPASRSPQSWWSVRGPEAAAADVQFPWSGHSMM
jgi:hypothetical protein